MQAHAIDAETGEPRGQLVGIRTRGEVRGTGQVGRVEADRSSIGNEMTALRPYETMPSRRRVQQVCHARRVVRPVIRDDKREERGGLLRRLYRECESDQHRPPVRDFHSVSFAWVRDLQASQRYHKHPGHKTPDRFAQYIFLILRRIALTSAAVPCTLFPLFNCQTQTPPFSLLPPPFSLPNPNS